MRTNIEIDDDLMAKAMQAGPYKTKKDAVEAGLKLLARQAAYRFRVEDPNRAVTALQGLPFMQKAVARAPMVIASLGAEARVPEALSALQAAGVKVFEAAPDHFDLYEYYRDRLLTFEEKAA